MIKSVILLVLCLILVSACSPQASIFIDEQEKKSPLQPLPQPTTIPPFPQGANIPDPFDGASKAPLGVNPEERRRVDYPVPFFPQAPYGYWDDLHNEACEEAAMIMAASYFQKEPLTKHDMEQKIFKLISWQEENGYTVDITAQEVKEILGSYFHIRSELSTEVNPESIIRELDNGNLIIIPAAGRMLKNPYYRRPGPLYHMLVIRGYDRATKEFITNDPGTKRGEAYRYPYNRILPAIHDWPKKGAGKDSVSEEEMNEGKKIMIIVGK